MQPEFSGDLTAVPSGVRAVASALRALGRQGIDSGIGNGVLTAGACHGKILCHTPGTADITCAVDPDPGAALPLLVHKIALVVIVRLGPGQVHSSFSVICRIIIRGFQPQFDPLCIQGQVPCRGDLIPHSVLICDGIHGLSLIGSTGSIDPQRTVRRPPLGIQGDGAVIFSGPG